MQWLIDIVYEKVIAALGGPPFYVYRGDPSFWDFTDFTLVRDGAWHELDLSGIVPAGAAAVHFRFQCVSPSVGPLILFRRVGQVKDFNEDFFKCYVAGIVTTRSCTVALDSNRHIEYKIASVEIAGTGLVVRGWWL